MGSFTQRGAPALPQLPCAQRQGLATKELVILLALAALVGLLMQVQSGALDLPALTGKPAVDKPKSKGKGGKGQATLVEGSDRTSPLEEAAQAYIPSREALVKKSELETSRLLGGLGGMDGRAASLLLAKLDPALAASTLASLPRRSVGRILDETEPEVASAWVGAVLAMQLPAIPDELKPAAARAGLYDNSTDLLAALRNAAGQSEAGGAAASEPPPAVEGSPAAGDSAATAEPPGGSEPP